MKPRITTPKQEFTVDYPEAVAFADEQSKVFWPHMEVKVEKDKQDILVNMTEAERHGVITTLKLFTKYEQIIGDDFWLNFVFHTFPRPADIQPMAAMFGAMELQVHAKFYSKLNEELGLATDAFYNSYKEDQAFLDRITYLKRSLSLNPEGVQSDLVNLLKLGMFTFGEGTILYSSFAFLKHFQSQGKNKLLNVVSGINFSARDENLHAEAAAWLFRTYQDELELDGLQKGFIKKEILKAAEVVYRHECAIIQEVFSKGAIEGITPKQLEHFVQSRINLCLRNLGYENLFEVPYNPIELWFYKGINGFHMGDFFNSVSNQYQRDWNTLGFVWE